MSEGRWIRGFFDKLKSREQYQESRYQLLTGGVVIPEDDLSTLFLDANGAARNVDMPAPSTNILDKVWTIQNPAAAAFSLTVRNNGGATIVVIPQAKAAQFMVYNKAGVLTYAVINTLA